MTLARALRASMVLLAAASPWSISLAEGALALATGVWIAGIGARRWPAWPGALARPVLVFAFVWIVAAVAAAGLGAGLREAAHLWVIVAAPVAATACADRRTRGIVWRTLLVSATLLGAYCWLEHVTGRDLILGRTLEEVGTGFMALGTFSHHLTLAGHALICTMLALAVTATAGATRTRAFCLVAAAGAGSALVLSFGRSAWIGLLAGVMVLAARRGGGVRRVALVATTLVIVCAALIPALRDRAVGAIGEDVVGPRWRLWQTSARIIEAHPVWGIGAGGWDAAFARYKVPGHYWATAHPHNDWLNVWVCSGLVGLAAFVWVWVCVGRLLLRSRSPAALAGLGACAAILVAGLFQCYQTDAEVALLLWGVVGATVAAAEETS